MHGNLRGCVLGLAGLMLAGCSGGGNSGNLATLGTPDLLALLRSGQPVLSCREGCLDAWRRAEPDARSFAAAGQWSQLAALVMRTGYQDDLTLYYLGRAAEGLGFGAAASYYRQSTGLSGTSISCANLSRACGGLTLPSAARERLTALERKPTAPKPRPPAADTAAQPAAAAASSPDAPQNPAPPPDAPQNPDNMHAKEYIEPPPASK